MTKEFPIIRKLGGRTAVKRELSARGMRISTRGLSHWACRGRIGGQYVPVLMEIAEKGGISYSSQDFIVPDEQASSCVIVSERESAACGSNAARTC